MDLERLRQDKFRLVNELKSAGAIFHGDKDSEIKCPFHKDDHPSGAIKANEKGEWRFTCYAGSCGFFGDFIDVRSKASGIHPDDIIKDLAAQSGDEGQHKKRYVQQWNSSAKDINKKREYTEDEIRNFENSKDFIEKGYKFVKFHVNKNPVTNKPEYIVARFKNPNTGRKNILQGVISKSGKGWILNSNSKNRPLYNRKRVIESKVVIVVEGENKVEALHTVGHVGTCSHGGSNAAMLTDWSLLAGKTIYIWRDNDEAGKKYEKDVYEIIKKLEPKPSIYFVNPENIGLNIAEDVVDFINKNAGSLSEEDKFLLIKDVLDDSEPEVTIFDKINGIVEDTIKGIRKNIEFPWHYMSDLAKALYPGMTTLLCGDAGSTKTLLMYECAVFWQSLGHKVSLYELEDDTAYHINRALAQKVGIADYTDDKWMKSHPDESRQILLENKQWITDFGNTISDCPDSIIDYDDILKWIELEVDKGTEILIIDPITAISKNGKTWEADLSFILKAKFLIRKTGARLIFITHSTKINNGIDFAGIAGGAAFARFPQTIFWLHRCDDETKKVMTPMGAMETNVNRVIKIIKTRNGKGQGKEIAFDFSPSTLRFHEIGTVYKTSKKKKNKQEGWE